MKINSPESVAALQALQAQERKAGQSGSTPVRAKEPQVGSSAQVQLSPAAAALSNAQEADGSFDMAKVQRVAQAIREGRFEINADKIADKLLSNARELMAGRDKSSH